MSTTDRPTLREWFPIPLDGINIDFRRWILLDASRYAVTGMLLTFTLVSIIVGGELWTFEMQQLLTETDAVQTLLNTLLSGIILLVSIVASISAIVLSYDITSVGAQEERIHEAMKLRQRIGRLAETNESPRDPGAFMHVMATVVKRRAEDLDAAVNESDGEFNDDLKDYVDAVVETAKDVETSIERIDGAEFGVLWEGLNRDYGTHLDRSNEIYVSHGSEFSEDVEEQFERLTEALELFATGKEFFKTLYYAREISHLSRTLLIVALPSIVITATTILAINARILPDIWLFGLPPLLTFVAVAFTIALAPYLVLTSYMLRVATVAYRTTSAGPFVLHT